MEYNRLRVQFTKQYEAASQGDSVIILIVATGAADREGHWCRRSLVRVVAPGPVVAAAIVGSNRAAVGPDHFARNGDIGFRLTGSICVSGLPKMVTENDRISVRQQQRARATMVSRRQPRRKNNVKTAVNPNEGAKLVPLVGKFMVNFGVIEYQSQLWIDRLALDDALVDLAIESSFARRTELVDQLVRREKALTEELKERCWQAWSRAQELSEVRNAIAHNPAVFGWHGPEEGAPHFVGIPVLRRLARNETGKVPYIGAEGLAKAVDHVVEVARDLERLFSDISVAIESSSPTHEK